MTSGFWPNDQQKFGLLSIHTNEYLEDRPPNFGELEHQAAVHAQAILASFAWLIGQASYQGKNCFVFNIIELDSSSQLEFKICEKFGDCVKISNSYIFQNLKLCLQFFYLINNILVVCI